VAYGPTAAKPMGWKRVPDAWRVVTETSFTDSKPAGGSFSQSELDDLKVYDGCRQVFSPFGGGAPGIPNPKFCPFDHECLRNGKSHCYMSITA